MIRYLSPMYRFIFASNVAAYLVLLSPLLVAQTIEEGNSYSFSSLSQESVEDIAELYPAAGHEVGDTTFTNYEGGTTDMKTYFVNGEQYDNIFNPNPTGIILNSQYFEFYCSLEKSIRQNFSNILQAKEFSYLGSRYLMIINFREDCLGDGCRYRCYNVFDITTPDRVRQIAFSSVFEGLETFGEYNNDGNLDFLRAAPKAPANAKEAESIAPGSENFLITAYTIKRGRAAQLLNKTGHAYYLFVNSDEFVGRFKVLQADWFFNVRDTSGQVAEATSYFAPYVSFDPLYRHMYNPDGVRIEKNRYSVYISDFGDLEAAQSFSRRMQKDFEDVYIMVDQYSGDIKFQVMVGNFSNRKNAEEYHGKLMNLGYRGELTDFRYAY